MNIQPLDASCGVSLKQLAEYVGGRVTGDPDFFVKGLAPLDRAGDGDLSFFTNPKYRSAAVISRAGAILTSVFLEETSANQLICENPYLALAKILTLFFPVKLPEPGIHPSAVIGENCTIAPDAKISAHVFVGRNVQIGANTVIFPGTYIGDRAKIGDHCIVYPNVTIYHGVTIGNRVILHASVVIGSDGFGFAKDHEEYFKIPQLGTVIIEDDVEIGACTTIDRGSMANTVISKGVKLDNLIMVAHNVTIGKNTVIAAQSGISGSSKVGERVVMAGQSGVAGHLEIGDDCTLTARCAVISSVPAGSIQSGYPQMEHSKWLKNQAVLREAAELKKKLKLLSERLAKLESKIDDLKES